MRGRSGHSPPLAPPLPGDKKGGDTGLPAVSLQSTDMQGLVSTFLATLFLSQVWAHHTLKSGECELITEFENACEFGHLYLKGKVHGQVITSEECNPLVPKQDFAEMPEVKYSEASEDDTYTLVVVDPDAPNHPKGTYYLHGIYANIKGSNLAQGDFSKATVLSEYIGPGPPANTGEHRYMFLVYKHDDPELKLTKALTDQDRKRFNLAEWIKALEGPLCGPYAGAQFRSAFK